MGWGWAGRWVCPSMPNICISLPVCLCLRAMGGDRREPKERVDRVDNISGSYGFQQNISQNWPNTWQASLLIYLSPCIFGPVFVFILLPKWTFPLMLVMGVLKKNAFLWVERLNPKWCTKTNLSENGTFYYFYFFCCKWPSAVSQNNSDESGDSERKPKQWAERRYNGPLNWRELYSWVIITCRFVTTEQCSRNDLMEKKIIL